MAGEQDWRTRVFSNGVHAMPREQWTSSAEEVNKGEVDQIQVSDSDHADMQFHVMDINDADVSDTGPPSYVTIIKGLQRVSKERQFSTHDDFTFDETTPAEWTQDIDEGKSCETFYTAISELKWGAHEPESFRLEIDPMQSEIHLVPTSPDSDQIQSQSSDLSPSDALARVLFPESGVDKNTSSAFESTEVGIVAEITCETVDSDYAKHPTEGSENSDSTESDKPTVVSKANLDDTDTEKAERIERRRKLLAKKKEARLKKAMEYNAREAERIEDTSVKGSEPMLSTESLSAYDSVHAGASSEESKTEDDFAIAAEDISDRAEWSKDEARKAKERRKNGQKERLLNLLSGCIIVHTGSAFDGDGYSNQSV